SLAVYGMASRARRPEDAPLIGPRAAPGTPGGSPRGTSGSPRRQRDTALAPGTRRATGRRRLPLLVAPEPTDGVVDELVVDHGGEVHWLPDDVELEEDREVGLEPLDVEVAIGVGRVEHDVLQHVAILQVRVLGQDVEDAPAVAVVHHGVVVVAEGPHVANHPAPGDLGLLVDEPPAVHQRPALL